MNRSTRPRKPNAHRQNARKQKVYKSEARASKSFEVPQAALRFAPAAFMSASPEAVRGLCQELATLAAQRFSDLTGTTWSQIAAFIVEQLRATGHDLSSFDESEGFQEWQAISHHPRGSFSLFLAFRAPASVEVTWKADDATFVGRA